MNIHILTSDTTAGVLCVELQRQGHLATWGLKTESGAKWLVAPVSPIGPSQADKLTSEAIVRVCRNLRDSHGDFQATANFCVARIGQNLPAQALQAAQGALANPVAGTPSNVAHGASGGPPGAIPATGLISPSQQKIIQIDITNLCPKACSNCTRGCGHTRDHYFMDMPTFKAAVDSLQGYAGMVGMMGGEPTLHPQFAEFCLYMQTKRPDPINGPSQYAPADDWAKAHRDIFQWRPWQKGLWTALGPGYRKHYELIQGTFRYQCINDHRGRAQHAALFMARSDFNIPDDEWLMYRNRCWLQRLWSASVTPRGAYFCEVAATMARLFKGPDGWKIEPEWWKRQPEEFGDQLQMCEYCCACLPVPSAVDSDETDLVTEDMYKRLRSIGSRKHMVIVRDTWQQLKAKHKPISETEPYLDGSDGLRVHEPTGLEVKHVTCCVVCRGYDDYLALTLPRMVEELDRVVVITSTVDSATQALARKCGAEVYISTILDEPGFRKGAALAEFLATLSPDSWVLQTDADIILRRNCGNRIRNMVLNPGALYYTERIGPRPDDWKSANSAARLALDNIDWTIFKETFGDGLFKQKAPWGFFQLFNLGSSALACHKTRYPAECASAEHDDATIASKWYGPEKCVQLGNVPLVVHLPHGTSRTNWRTRRSPRLDDDTWWVDDPKLLWRISYRSGRNLVGLWRLMEKVDIPQDSIIVEIGTMLGDSAMVMSLAKPTFRILTVDPGPNEEVQAECAKRLSHCPNVKRLTMTSREAAELAKLAVWRIGLVYLDGDHTEEGVAADIELWKPLVLPGGYICGHDYGEPAWEGVKRAVDLHFGSPDWTFADKSWMVALKP